MDAQSCKTFFKHVNRLQRYWLPETGSCDCRVLVKARVLNRGTKHSRILAVQISLQHGYVSLKQPIVQYLQFN